MSKILSIIAVLGMFLAVTNESEAKGSSSKGSHGISKGTNKTQPTKIGTTKGTKMNPEHGKINGIPPSRINGSMGSKGEHREHHWRHRTYGRDYRFGSRYWNSRYGCDFCWSTVDSCYFYFYAPAQCYFPVTVIAEYPPVAAPVAPVAQVPAPVVPVATGIQITNINQNTLANGAPVVR